MDRVPGGWRRRLTRLLTSLVGIGFWVLLALAGGGWVGAAIDPSGPSSNVNLGRGLGAPALSDWAGAPLQDP